MYSRRTHLMCLKQAVYSLFIQQGIYASKDTHTQKKMQLDTKACNNPGKHLLHILYVTCMHTEPLHNVHSIETKEQ